ncbi:MAG TPA: winged helix-turn-helix domain-containing protein [Trueperaceae bacterium]|nr:winged helix-turn-helix domain-containing protein [Trueperaceae bacterium]
MSEHAERPLGLRDAVEITDPRALRALAHPTRLKLVTLLRRAGPLTATQAGARLGQSPASCSFHLRQLARWGLVEEAGGGRGRERPWRATAPATSWKVTGPESVEPAAAVSSLVVRYQSERILGSLARLPAEAPAWQRAHEIADTRIKLTPAQLQELAERVWAVIRSYRPAEGGAGAGAEERTEDAAARLVGVFFAAFPEVEDEDALAGDATAGAPEPGGEGGPR